MIQKLFTIIGYLSLTLTAFARGSDEEILKDLEFFKAFKIVRSLDEISDADLPSEYPALPVTKKSEVKNESH